MGAFFARARPRRRARARARGEGGAGPWGACAVAGIGRATSTHPWRRTGRWTRAPLAGRPRAAACAPAPARFFFLWSRGKKKCRRMASCRQWGRADARPRGQQRARPRAARGTGEDATAPGPRSRAFACAAGEREGGEEGRSARVLSASTATLSSVAADAAGCAAADRRAPLASGRPGGVCARRRQRRYAPRCAHPSPLQPMLTQPLSHAPSPVAPE